MIIDAAESKSVYLRLIEEFCEARANKRRERDIKVRIKEMHTHMRETELMEEEELRQCEEAIKNGRKN
jgi:hypothetical protein